MYIYIQSKNDIYILFNNKNHFICWKNVFFFSNMIFNFHFINIYKLIVYMYMYMYIYIYINAFKI